MRFTDSRVLQTASGWLKRHGVAVALILAVLLPYHRVIAGLEIPIPDDGFVSDLADGEFPARVEAGRILRQGEWPVWTSRSQSGMPLLVDPLSIGLFALFPSALALGLLLGILLSTGALGTFVLSRHLGASRAGAFVAGLAFAWSGFWVCQLRHLGIIGVVALFPWALYCIEQAFARRDDTPDQARTIPLRRRIRWFSLFSLVLGLQLIAGFPQSVYISCLIYGGLLVARILWLTDFSTNARWRERISTAATILVVFAVAVAVAALIGMTTLMPLWELGQNSDRNAGVTWEWISRWRYDIENAWSFLIAYKNGDISDFTYTLSNSNIFWENYGYVGFATFIAAIGAVAHAIFSLFKARRSAALLSSSTPGQFVAIFWGAAGVVTFIIILGDATPLYRLMYDYLPAFNSFRFPSRFLFVVNFAIPLLAAIGITRLQQLLEKKHSDSRRLLSPALFGVFIVILTWMDVVGHNARQNPTVDSGSWLKAPRNVDLIQHAPENGRTYSPSAMTMHMHAFNAARGWSGDLTPYFAHREFLQPNANLLHNLSAVNAYSGISPRWVIDLLGDHSRTGMLSNLESNTTRNAYFNWLEACHVRWFIYQRPLKSGQTEVLTQNGLAVLHRVRNTLPRARFAQGVEFVPDMAVLKARSIRGDFDPRTEVAVHNREDFEKIPAIAPAATPSEQRVKIAIEKENEVVIETRNKDAGLLLLADTWYPGWKATVDGVEKDILRVNVMHRGVTVPAGIHRVRFSYEPDWLKTSFILTLFGLIILMGALWLARSRTKEN